MYYCLLEKVNFLVIPAIFCVEKNEWARSIFANQVSRAVLIYFSKDTMLAFLAANSHQSYSLRSIQVLHRPVKLNEDVISIALLYLYSVSEQYKSLQFIQGCKWLLA